MKKSTKTLLILGGAVGVLAIGGYAYAQAHKPAVVPAGALPSGSVTPVASFTQGQKYTFAAQAPAAETTSSAVLHDLTQGPWSNITILYFGGSGTIPPGFPPVAGNGYIASATFTGPSGTAVPSGVVAAATP